MGGSSPPPAQAAAPAPAPAAPTPAAPIFNELNQNSEDATNYVANARRGRSSLKIKRDASTQSATGGGSGLNIPT
jgi:3-oxoacyl-ACP reductase-like protein